MECSNCIRLKKEIQEAKALSNIRRRAVEVLKTMGKFTNNEWNKALQFVNTFHEEKNE